MTPKETKVGIQAICVVVALFVLVILVGLGWSWYVSGIQAEVYRRQGIEMTRWEIFIGAKPAKTVDINSLR